MNEKKQKKKIISISTVITILVSATIFAVVASSSGTSSVLLGSKMMNASKDQLALSIYAIEKEIETMSRSNTKAVTVDAILEEFKADTGIDITIFEGNKRMFTTLGEDAINTRMDSDIWKAISTGENYFSKNANVNGEKYYAYYKPFMTDGECVGAIFAGLPKGVVDKGIMVAMANTVMISVFSGIIFVVITLLISRKMSLKLSKLNALVDALAANDLRANYEHYEKVKDDIDLLHNNLVDFVAQNREMIGCIKDTCGILNNISTDLSEGMISSAHSSEEISSAIHNITDGTQDLSRDTQHINEQIEEMGMRIDSIKTYMDTLTDASAQMMKVEEETFSNMSVAEKENAVIKSDIEEVNGQIDITNKSVEEIRGFINAIKDIADQTNLLSLNASIEAARAGEHGRGFAVVAEEIRKLSEQSTDSAHEVETTINNLLNGYSLIIQKMDVTTQNIVKQNEQIEGVKNAFNVLDSGIKDTVKQIEAVTKATDELDVMKNHIVDKVCSLSAVSEENAASTEEINASIEELNAVITQASDNAKSVEESAKSLNEYVSVFRVD